MDERRNSETQAIAVARGGFSESTGRRIKKGRRALMSQRLPRQYRTRVDPFKDVWRAKIVPLLKRAPGIRATTVLGGAAADVSRSLSGPAAPHASAVEPKTWSDGQRLVSCRV